MKRNNYARMQQTMRKGVYVVLVGTLFLTTTGCQKAQETLTQVRQELRQEIALEQSEQQTKEVTPIKTKSILKKHTNRYKPWVCQYKKLQLLCILPIQRENLW